ncbi:PpiC-type peptidyl-prolyl cis-trans isomerase [Oscillochloris trichoides DG-6]|uniref:PpiC-type peptidyl-prolyl cis-trans isomerase n=1 Tax=Oscillochloris trichoides DG-6 TaxID=765420 RepID=E1IEZ8_9CHLR|nr:peptidylprolyl isomerase [Oscillochloris trichoides]EFO80243.1 PpiC-type peptidyl-prolyl cis-trans isomerase [Oscillochloris trichoides DG-6]
MTDPHSSDAHDSRLAEPDEQNASDSGDYRNEPVRSGAASNRRTLTLIGSLLLLLAIGGGVVASIMPPAATTPTTTSSPAANVPTSNLPTALPLPQAIGDVTSTEPITQVGDAVITRGEFVRAYQPGDEVSAVLKQLIQVELLLQQAGVEGVTVEASELDAEIAAIKSSFGTPEEFTAMLAANQIESEEAMRSIIERNMLIDKMVLSHTTMEQVHARHILLATTAETVDARKAEAEAILAQIQGGADFAQLAAEKSEDPGSKDKGGDLGWAGRGMFVGPFDEAVFSMQKDEVRLVQTDFGWHIIQVLDPSTVRSLDSADLLQTMAGQQAFTETFMVWLDQLYTDAEQKKTITILMTDDQLVSQP